MIKMNIEKLNEVLNNTYKFPLNTLIESIEFDIEELDEVIQKELNKLGIKGTIMTHTVSKYDEELDESYYISLFEFKDEIVLICKITSNKVVILKK